MVDSMVVAAQQPYFAPYPGFFYRAFRADVLVLLDEVQFPRGTTWLSRNRFKNDQGTLWLTIPVWKKGLGLQKIREVRICREGRWQRKHLESLRHAYSKSPFFREHLPLWEELFTSPPERLLDLNLRILHYLLDLFGLGGRVVLQSALQVHARGEELLVALCRRLGATAFLAPVQAQSYLRPELFQEQGLELRFLRFKAPVYPQLWGEFLANLSTFDLVFNCGPKAWEIICRSQTDA